MDILEENVQVPNKVLSTQKIDVQPRKPVKSKSRLHIFDQLGSSCCFELAMSAQVVAEIRMVSASIQFVLQFV